MDGVFSYRAFSRSGFFFPAEKLRARGFGIVLAATALASGQAEAQSVGAPTNPIQAFFTGLFGGGAPRASAPDEGNGSPRGHSHRDRHGSSSSGKRQSYGGGSYLVCVRACDGAFFPVSTSGMSRWDKAGEVCGLLCPNATMAVYSFPFGGTIDEAVSLTGARYSDLANARKFEQTVEAGCSCRTAGQSWADALRAAEAHYGHGSHDILVTQETSDRMSRPVVDPKAKVAPASFTPAAEPGPPDAPQTDLSLDANGVDKDLKAATAVLSKEASGIKDEEAQGPVHIRLKEGRLVEEIGPDGMPRRVRVVTPSD